MITILLIHYIGLAYFQQPIRAMQFNAAEHQKQSCFKAAFKSWKAAFSAFKSSFIWSSFKKQRSAARPMQRSAAQRMCEHTYMQMQRSAAQRSSSHAAFKSNMHLQRSAAYVWAQLYYFNFHKFCCYLRIVLFWSIRSRSDRILAPIN